MKKGIKNALIAAAAAASIWAGSNLYSIANSSKEKVAVPIVKTEIENPKRIFAVLANGSGPSQSKRFSEKNFNYSLLDTLSFYKLLKEEGVSDENISLLIYNPANTDIFETEEYKSLLEKKLFSDVLPSKKDKIEIDGVATKDNFFNALKNIHPDSNDVVYVVISNSSPKEINDGVIYGSRRGYIELDKESVYPSNLQDALNSLKSEKKFVILNNGDSENFLPSFNRLWASQYFLSSAEKEELSLRNTLGISSPKGYGFEKETFVMNLADNYSKNKKQAIKNMLGKLKNESYYFDKGEKSPEECPWINSPLFDN